MWSLLRKMLLGRQHRKTQDQQIAFDPAGSGIPFARRNRFA
jgi:hypothetical protein